MNQSVMSGVATLCRMTWEGLCEEVTSEQRPDSSRQQEEQVERLSSNSGRGEERSVHSAS